MKAADVMTTKVISLSADAPITQAIRLMMQHRISGVPVVDAEQRVIGIVTEGDFLRRVETGTTRKRPRWLEILLGPGRLADEYVHGFGRKVEEIMTPDPICVKMDTPLEEIVALMERKRIKRLPVLKHGRLAGIVSRANLVHALASLVHEIKPGLPADSEIRASILAEIEKQPWSPGKWVEVVVRDGVVSLYGTIFDERERQALQVAAENVPGVKEIKDHVVWVEPISGMFIEGKDDREVA